jgi:hypothetical protein
MINASFGGVNSLIATSLVDKRHPAFLQSSLPRASRGTPPLHDSVRHIRGSLPAVLKRIDQSNIPPQCSEDQTTNPP